MAKPYKKSAEQLQVGQIVVHPKHFDNPGVVIGHCTVRSTWKGYNLQLDAVQVRWAKPYKGRQVTEEDCRLHLLDEVLQWTSEIAAQAQESQRLVAEGALV